MNRIVQRMDCAMLDEFITSATFWGEATHTTVNILNKARVRVDSDKTLYELCYGKPSTVKHFRVFGSKHSINNNDEKLGKFEARADEGILLGYSSKCKGYKCYNKRLQKIIECIDVVIDEACTDPRKVTSTKENDDDELFPT